MFADWDRSPVDGPPSLALAQGVNDFGHSWIEPRRLVTSRVCGARRERFHWSSSRAAGQSVGGLMVISVMAVLDAACESQRTAYLSPSDDAGLHGQGRAGCQKHSHRK
jgi:hypothetical protein